MATKLVDSRWKKNPTKRISKRRKLKSALKRIFNYMKTDSYMFAPLFHPQSSLVSSGEVLFKPMMKKEKKLVEDVNDYLKCDTYMYAPLAADSGCDGTTSPPLETDDDHSPERCRHVEHSILQSERVSHFMLHQLKLELFIFHRKSVITEEAISSLIYMSGPCYFSPIIVFSILPLTVIDVYFV